MHTSMSTSMSTSLRLTALALTTVLTLSACSGSDDSGDSEDPADAGGTGSSSSTAEERDPGDVLDAAVEATVDTRRFTLASEAELDINGMDLSLAVEGSIDYDEAISDTTVSLDQQGDEQTIEILADGESLWVAAEGSQVPAFPDDATYLQGEASQLTEDDTFAPEDLLGVVYVLRGGTDAEAGDIEEIDGVETRSYTFTIPYDEAVEAVDAAGDDVETFTDAFSLTGDAESADLEIEVSIGTDDDVVRRLQLDVQTDVPVEGGYDLELTDVGEEVEAPDAPDEDEIATGSEADALLEQLLASS